MFSGLSADSAWVLIALFAAIMLAAASFVVWPVWRAPGTGALSRLLLAGAIAALVFGIGGGLYLYLGSPGLAVRSVAPPDRKDVPGLVAALSRRMRERPRDLTGWSLLGRGYLSLNDPQQAAVAFRTASELAPQQAKPQLLSAYGEALTLASGTVTPEAESAFRAALAGQPKDFAARFYLGEAYSARRDATHALALWQGLLRDSPANAPWRAGLVDRMAALRASVGGAPDIGQMVEGLAARLRTAPDDLPGWLRLVRAYVVLGQEAKARSARVAARAAMKGRTKDLAALDAEAKALKLED
jgi:cytochrome c-type biogenesis protein CcmH